MHDLPQQLLIGLQLGSIYALIALGYTMVYGVLKLINFAHGDVYMVGAYSGIGAIWLLGTRLPGLVHFPSLIPSWAGAILVLLGSMLVCALLGLVIEQAAYRPLRTRAWVAPAVFLGAAAGYVAYGIASDADRTPASAALIGVLVWAALAALLYTTQRRRSAGNASRLTALITAIGVSLFLENFGVLKQIFSSNPQHYPTLVNLPPPLHRGGVTIGLENVLIFGLSIFLMLTLTYIVTRTRVGRAIRAVSFDADAAALMGINTDRIIAFTFMLGAGLAGAAGVLVCGLQHTQFNPYLGVADGLKAFVAAVLGGIGNIPGAVLGGLIMGLAETMVVAYGPRVGIDSSYRDAVAFFLLILVLLVRPAGLLGKFAPEKV
jgi:branched-chain amino acid transport system permease protein